SHDFNIGNLQPLHRCTSQTILGPRGLGIQFYYAALLMTPRLNRKDLKQLALTEFSKADRLEAPALDREYLARALAACGETRAAWAAYGKTVSNPGQLWYQPEIYPPGRWADMLYEYAKLGRQLDEKDAHDALGSYLSIRQRADKGLPDVAAARRLR
ncbi:MAG: hypothetical protein ACLQOO_02200, partial [Terriglobia bacterium]